MLRVRGNSTMLVQLGGLEPPTSCSTDRRSNQLSYNCILAKRATQRARRTRRKLGATACFGKAGQTPQSVVEPHAEQRPGRTARASFNQGRDLRSDRPQAAGL